MPIEAGTTRITALEYSLLSALVERHLDRMDAATKRVGDPEGFWTAARPAYKRVLEKIDVLGTWAWNADIKELGEAIFATPALCFICHKPLNRGLSVTVDFGKRGIQEVCHICDERGRE